MLFKYLYTSRIISSLQLAVVYNHLRLFLLCYFNDLFLVLQFGRTNTLGVVQVVCAKFKLKIKQIPQFS